MAKGNMLLGYAHGKVGDLVMYRADGQQVTRARAQKVKNPKTVAQTIQRMIFGTVGEAYKRVQDIANHSFEGVAYGAKSQQHFMSVNLKRLRAYYPISNDPDSLDAELLVNLMAFAKKSDAAQAGVGLILSEGSLPAIAVQNEDTKDAQFAGFGLEYPHETEGTLTVSDVMYMCGAKLGDQITICALVYTGTGYEFMKSRYVLDNAATADDLKKKWDGEFVRGAMDSHKTQISAIKLVKGTDWQKEYLVPTTTQGTIVGAAAILSRKSDSGSWLRSPAVLVNVLDEAPDFQAEQAFLSWQDSSTVIETTSSRYLNNAELSGE